MTFKKTSKRHFIQVIFFLIQNPLLKNFINGNIYQGSLKKFCTPGLNCYSCPAAITACPIGATQFFLAGYRQSISMFVTGFLIITGVVFGRFICGYLCPFGLLQDLLYKIKSVKIKTPLHFLRYIKYLILALFVIILPYFIRHNLSGIGDPWFCKYICPSGMVFGAFPLLNTNDFLHELIGMQFIIKTTIVIGVLFTTIFIFRFFCRVLCPLGAFYSFFNPISFLRICCDKKKCINCGNCAAVCNIKINPSTAPNSPECVRCNSCVSACKTNAISNQLKSLEKPKIRKRV